MQSRFWQLVDDGAKVTCPDCRQHKGSWDMLYYKTPDGSVGLSCKDCIDPEWLKGATFCGNLTDSEIKKLNMERQFNAREITNA